MKLTFTKRVDGQGSDGNGNLIKYVKNKDVADILVSEGWQCPEYGEQPVSERDALKARATELGLSFPKNIKTEKLIEIISKKQAD